MKPSPWYLKVRSYQNTGFVSVWLVLGSDSGHESFLWGECNPKAVEEIAKATGLRVERETSELSKVKPFTPPECATVEEQASLF